MSLESLVRNAKRKVKNTLLGAALLASPYISFACGGGGNPNPPAPNDPPTITANVLSGIPFGNPLISVTNQEGEVLDVQFDVNDSDGDFPIGLSITNAPAGATFNSVTRTLTWITNYSDGNLAPGVYTINLQATDSRGAVTNSSLNFIVNDVAAPRSILCNTTYPSGVSIFKLASMLPDGTDLKSIGKAGETGTRPRYFPLDNTKMSVGKGAVLGGSCLEDIADGANQVLISDSLPIIQSGTAVSPDGSLVAQNDDRLGYRAIHLFNRATAVYIGKLTTNTNEERSIVFSPDGLWIYYAADKGGQHDICRFKADRTGVEENLTNTPSFGEFSPDVSPDGTKLVYSRYDSPTLSQLYEANIDGSSPVKITNSLGNPSADDSGPGWPNYSSDGKKIAYTEFSGTGGVVDYGDLVILYKDSAGNWAYSEKISNPAHTFLQADW